jgi:hypothetical protein
MDGYGAATNFSWAEISKSGVGFWWSDGSLVNVAAKTSSTTITLRLTASNSCGSCFGTYTFTTKDLLPMFVSPNPASENIQVTVLAQDTASIMENTSSVSFASAEKAINAESAFTIKIYNNFGIICYSGMKTGTTFEIPVSNLKDGIYVLEASDGINRYSQQIVIKH